jgi:2-keto-4-pentenoate hydratase
VLPPTGRSQTSEHAAERTARRLFEAFGSGVPIEPPSDELPGFDVAQAYAIQRALRRLHEDAGRSVGGRKIGLTSEAMQRQLGVAEPDYGLLFDTHVFPSGARLDLAAERMIAPRLEAELGFVLAREVRGPGVTAKQILQLDPHFVPVFEIIDSRVVDWRITLADTIADNASCFGSVVGEASPLGRRDLATTTMTLLLDGRTLVSGTGGAVMGDPARAVAWLANALAAYDEPLPAGELILSGSMTAAVELVPGHFEARFGDGLGSVELEIGQEGGVSA